MAKSAFGFGAIGLSYLLETEKLAGSPMGRVNPLSPKAQNFPAQAKQVIFIFLQGGMSHVDTFDPKPELDRLAGKPLPDSFQGKDLNSQSIKAGQGTLLGSPFHFKQYGQSGIPISNLFENLGKHADDLAVIRSCYHDSFIHGPALNYVYTGSSRNGHPSVGAWLLYGLGSECDNLPAFVVMTTGKGRIIGRRLPKRLYGSGYLPAVYQGTLLSLQTPAITNLKRPPEISSDDQEMMLEQMHTWDRRHLGEREDDSRLSARIKNYELAFRMQMAAPDLVDLSKEPDHVKRLYGMENPTTEEFGKMCLLSRRMIERGVRMIQLTSTDWDGHEDCRGNHEGNAGRIDLPIAGLIEDLKLRGLLESTLIVCTSEFGRTPLGQAVDGRDHNPHGFTSWMAGGGIRGGKIFGATDEFGFAATENKVHVHDLHATMLSLMGLDHKKLTYLFQGRDRRLSDIGGENDLAQRMLQA